MSRPQLLRSLGLRDATALVVGIIIGTGIFLKSAIMANTAGSPLFLMLAWIVAGLLSFAGALTYAELGSLFHEAGGEYIYMRNAYGRLPAFLYGWMRFWIGAPGSIAAYAVGAASFLSGVLPLTREAQVIIALALILSLTLLNCLAVSYGGIIQTLFTGLKIFLILLLVGGVLLSHGSFSDESINVTHAHWPGWSAFGTALLAALWAFDGWNSLPSVSGEIKNPQRNIPWSLAFGLGIVLILYLVSNFAYIHALPWSEILTSNSKLFPTALPVATKASIVAFGPTATQWVSAAFVISALGAMNGSILTGARVPYAMAADQLLPHSFARISESARVPYVSLLIQGAWACLLALSGTFDQLTDAVVFASWIFYAAIAASVFLWRKRLPDRNQSFKVIGYPLVPLVFIVCAILLLFNTIIVNPRESLAGIGFILLGIPVYFFRSRLE